MKFFKRVVIITLFISIIVFLISLFLPSSLNIKRSVIIDADQEIIFNQVNDLKKWKNWSPWAAKDPSIYNNKNAFSGPPLGAGAIFNWESKNEEVGKGNLKIISSEKYQAIETVVNFGMGPEKGNWNFTEIDEGIETTWGITIDFGFNPISKFFGLFIEGSIAPDFELGLNKLKAVAENLPKIKRVQVSKKHITEQEWFLAIRDTINQQEMNNIHGKLYAKIAQYMDKNNLKSASAPLTIYHFWSDSLIDIEVGIPINDSVVVTHPEIILNNIDTGNVVTAIHYGPYERLPETYFGINEWMRKDSVSITGPPWEVYLTDPAEEPNREKWETAIFFPIE